MTSMLLKSELLANNPLDLAELVVMDRDLAFERTGDGELVAEITGVWCNYRVWFTWDEDMGTMMLSCAYETKLPRQCRTKAYSLLALVNEKLWLGHFDLSSEEGVVAFRHTLLLREGVSTSTDQLQDLLDIALTECERFYPAFQSVIWGGKTPAEALEIAVFETVGEA